MFLEELAKWLIPLGVVAIMIMALSFSLTTAAGAPWVPTRMRDVHKMLTMAEVGPGDIVYDLGCGDGRMIVTAARKYGAMAVGIEIDPFRYAWCQLWITVLGLRNRVRVTYGNFFDHELGDANVVTCYLLQKTNQELEEKLERELTPGTRIVSNTFTVQHVHVSTFPKGPGRR
jgi:SAM-dependent methyltransferase